jgi:hypothetical protein
MGWRDLLAAEDERLVAPWVGGRALRAQHREWKITGRLPNEYGWYEFKLDNRKAAIGEAKDPPDMTLRVQGIAIPVLTEVGYLIGDRMMYDDVRVGSDPAELIAHSDQVYLIEPGLDLFARVRVARYFEDGPLIFVGIEFPLGPEDEVMNAYLDRKVSVDDIPNVVPALDASFRFSTWQRAEAERRRLEEQRRREAEERERERRERRERIAQQLGTAAGRREMAEVDFGEAARAALTVGGAQYLDHHPAYHRDEMTVRYRTGGQRFECTCNRHTLRIIDPGICLTNHARHHVHGVAPGESGGDLFTLESLPPVIREARHLDELVVYRHLD